MAFADELADWLRRPRIEPLRDGVRVVVAGPPNAGKSSLYQCHSRDPSGLSSPTFQGPRATHIEVPMALAGVPFVLTDTAGLRDTDDRVEADRRRAARARLIDAADILLWLGEPSDAPDHPRLIRGPLHAATCLAVQPCRAVTAVSRVTGQGSTALLARLVELWRDRFFPARTRLALNRRQAGRLAEADSALRRAASTRRHRGCGRPFAPRESAFDRLTGRAGVEDMLDASVRAVLPGQIDVSRGTCRVFHGSGTGMTSRSMYDVLVIGAGHAGCEAAAAAARRGARVGL